jgi:hypothetical protein
MRMLIAMATVLLLTGCQKEEGTGGNASIRGRIWVRDYNSSFTTLIGEYPAEDTYVYIIYGDNVGYDKRIKTDYEGEFEFRYLYPGTYTIYVYSADSTFTDLTGEVPVIQEVELDKREEKDLGDIVILQ